MRCFYCGKEIAEDSNFCDYCGMAVTKSDIPIVVKKNIPYDINDLPESVLSLLRHDSLLEATNKCVSLYAMNKETAYGLVKKMYIQSLLLSGNKLQALRQYCELYNVSLIEGNRAIDDISRKLK